MWIWLIEVVVIGFFFIYLNLLKMLFCSKIFFVLLKENDFMFF